MFDHACNAKWTGRSGSMEAGLAFKMANDTYTNSGGRVHAGVIMSDNDMAM